MLEVYKFVLVTLWLFISYNHLTVPRTNYKHLWRNCISAHKRMKLIPVSCHLQKSKFIKGTVVLSNAPELIEESTGVNLQSSGLDNDLESTG